MSGRKARASRAAVGTIFYALLGAHLIVYLSQPINYV